MFLNEILILFKKEWIIEWRQKYALNGVILYLLSTIFIIYLSLGAKRGALIPEQWNALFWIVILFTAVTAVAKSFMLEKYGRNYYYYCIANSQTIILAKICYNACLMIVIGSLGYFIYSIVLGNPVKDLGLFYFNILLGALALSTTLTMISAIAAKAYNSHTLMTILSLPLIVPILLLVIGISANAINGVPRSFSSDEMITLIALNILLGTVAFILFPYLWRS